MFVAILYIYLLTCTFQTAQLSMAITQILLRLAQLLNFTALGFVKDRITDISMAQQIVQTNHATFEMAAALPKGSNGIPSIVLIGVPDKKALDRVIKKLINNSINFSDFYEPDHGIGLSAVATVPVTEKQRRILHGYRLWNESTFNTRVAQWSEHRHSRKAYPEVGGSIPSTCANEQVA